MDEDRVEGMVELPTGALFLRRQGRRRDLPVIVLEAGGGATSAWWAHVQAALATVTEVVAYDRAGLGLSAGVNPRQMDALRVADRLGDLLRIAKVEAPYLLVGHSLGALYAQYFVVAHPERVAGLVLVDPTSRQAQGDGVARFALAAVVRLLQATAACRDGRALDLFRNLVRDLPDAARQGAEAAMEDSRHLATFARELGGIGRIRRQLARGSIPWTLPLLVVSAGRRGGRPEAAKRILAEHAQRAAASVWGEAIVIHGATHGSLLTDPACAQALAAAIIAFARRCVSPPARLENPSHA